MSRGVLQLLRWHNGNTPVAEFDVRRRVFKWGVTKKLVPIAVYQGFATREGLKKGRTVAPETANPIPIRIGVRGLDRADPTSS